MSNDARTTLQLPVKAGPLDTSDQIVFVYGISNPVVAQTAVMAISSLFANTANLKIVVANLNISDIRADPANSTALTVPKGTLFFSNSFGYFAVSNNNLVRWALNTF